MPLAVIEEKMSRVSPQLIPELSAFVDFLLYRQGESGVHAEQAERASFLDLLPVPGSETKAKSISAATSAGFSHRA